jgi:hypothetical protein
VVSVMRRSNGFICSLAWDTFDDTLQTEIGMNEDEP